MENPFPEIRIFEPLERLKTVGRFIGRLLTPAPHSAPLCASEHYRGAEEMLSHLQEPTDAIEA